MSAQTDVHSWIVEIFKAQRMLFREIRKIRLSRNFLTFLIFLFISVLLWGFISLREIRSVPIEYTLVIKDVPNRVVFTSDVPSTVTLYIRGRGFSFFEYFLQKGADRKLVISYSTIEKTTGHFVLDMKTWKTLLEKELTAGLELDSSSPYVLDVFFSTGYHKRFPVLFRGRVETGAQYLLTDMSISPDSVDVYAPIAMLETITAVHTIDTVFRALENSVECNLPIMLSRGMRCIPDSAHFVANVDLYTEKTVEVPIYSENIPQNKVLRTFPQRASVKFHVSMALFDSIVPENFIIIVDYSKITPSTQRAPLVLSKYPENVNHISIHPESVEFVVEQTE